MKRLDISIKKKRKERKKPLNIKRKQTVRRCQKKDRDWICFRERLGTLYDTTDMPKRKKYRENEICQSVKIRTITSARYNDSS